MQGQHINMVELVKKIVVFISDKSILKCESFHTILKGQNMVRTLVLSVVFVSSQSLLVAAEPQVKCVDNVSDLMKLGVFDDVIVERVSIVEQVSGPEANSVNYKRVHHGDAFGWRKPVTCLSSVAIGLMTCATIYPPAFPFFILLTKITTLTKIGAIAVATGIGIGIINNNIDNRFSALAQHNNNDDDDDDQDFSKIEFSRYHYQKYFLKSWKKYIVDPIVIGAVLGLAGVAGSRYKLL